MTSRRPLPAAARRASGLGRPDHVAAGFLVGFELDETLLLGFLEEVGEPMKAIVRLVEARIPALQRLLHHRAPDALVGVALRHQRLERAEHQVKGLLLLVAAVALVAAGAHRRRFASLLGRAALLLVGAHQVVVVDEFVAVVDQQVGARVLYADADHRLRVLAQLRHQRRKIRISAHDDERVDVGLGVAKVEGVHHHADVGGVLARLAYVRNLDQLERCRVHGCLEFLVPLPVAVRLLDHDRALGEQPFEHLRHVELRVSRLFHAEGDVLEVAEHGKAACLGAECHYWSLRGACGACTAPAAAAWRERRRSRQPSISEYPAGTTTRVSKVEVIMPPITASESGLLVSAPAPRPMAAGMSARIMVSEVITTGRMRVGQASRSASSTLRPWSRRWLVRSTSKIEFFATRPISSTRPMPE